MHGESSLHSLSGEVFTECFTEVFYILVLPQHKNCGVVLCVGPGFEAEVSFEGPALVGEHGRFVYLVLSL